MRISDWSSDVCSSDLRGVECVTDSGGPDKELTPAERRAERIAAARTALAEAYAADPGSVDRFNGRMARIDAARKRERQRVEHLALGADRPEPELVRPDALSRTPWKTHNARLRPARSQTDATALEARHTHKECEDSNKTRTPQ